MKTLFMMRGLPASGKTVRAKQMLAEFGAGNAKRVNKDELRAMVDDGRWSQNNEEFILAVRDSIVSEALAKGLHVIVDDTNLAPKHELRLRNLVREHGPANFEVVDFSHVSVDECIDRDSRRQNYVGEKVIRDMYRKYLAPPPVSPPAWDPAKLRMILVDIDGTLAEMDGRGPFEWDKVSSDKVRQIVVETVQALGRRLGAGLIFMSGRDSCCREDTEQWLNKAFGGSFIFPGLTLLMRPEGDRRKDYVVKQELYEQHVRDSYNVVAIFDDRPQVLRLWQSLGYSDRLFNVGDGREF